MQLNAKVILQHRQSLKEKNSKTGSKLLLLSAALQVNCACVVTLGTKYQTLYIQQLLSQLLFHTIIYTQILKYFKL